MSEKGLIFLNSKKRFLIARGGRDSAKSYTIATLLIILAISEPNIQILCIKGTLRSIKDSVKSLLEKIIAKSGLLDKFSITEQEIIYKPNNSRFIFYGLQNATRIRSLEGVKYCWLEEASIDVELKALTDDLFPTIRTPGNKIFVSYNPRFETDAVHILFGKPSFLTEDSEVVEFLYTDNEWISIDSLRYIRNLRENDVASYNHLYLGQMILETQGALWQKKDIVYLTESERNELLYDQTKIKKAIVSIDPSISANKNSDSCGICVILQLKEEDMYIVAEEATKIQTPNQWVASAISLYQKWNCAFILYEENQGGLIIKDLISKTDPAVLTQAIRANKSKIIRAEPISALYKAGKVKHWKVIPQLEYEMLTYDGTGKSPNSLDAMVHGITKLHFKPSNFDGLVEADMSKLQF